MAAFAGSPDVGIIGGGIVGAALAAELAVHGMRVRLYERTGIAAAASGRNSGVVWHPTDRVLASLYLESLDRYRRLPAELEAALPVADPDRGFALPSEPAGILGIGWDENEVRAQADALAASAPGFASSFVDPGALRRLEPSLAPGLAGVLMEIGYPVAPAAATRALAALARAHGADLRIGADARVARDGRRAVGVSVDGATQPCGAVVVAAGPWTPSLVDPGGTWRPIRPYWGVIVELELGGDGPRHVLEEAAVEAATAPGARRETEGSVGFSLVTAGGRSALGSTFLPMEPEPAAFEARLRDRGAAYVPAIAATRTRGLRACARPLATDGRPLVGAIPGRDNLLIAAGHGPWGISTGPASARHLAALLLGRPDPRTPEVAAATDPARFDPPAA